MTADFDARPFEDAMWDAATAVTGKRAEIVRLESELVELRNAAEVAMKRYGAALSVDDRSVPPSVIRKLYWEHRDLTTQSIARALGLRGGGARVYLHAGESYFDVDCPAGCGASVRLAARTTPIRPCESCSERQLKARRERFEAHQLQAEQERQDRDAWIRKELAAGRTAEELYVDLVAQYDTNGPLEHLRELAAETKASSDSQSTNV